MKIYEIYGIEICGAGIFYNCIELTKSDIQKVKGFENITDEQADKISEFLALYSIIIFDKMNGKYES